MEQVASLTWFYANERSWNPYYHDDTLLARIEIALNFYMRLQATDGGFPEGEEGLSRLAPTAFGTVALTSVLADLRSSQALPHQLSELEHTLAASSEWIMSSERGYWSSPRVPSNQVVAGLVGVSRVADALQDQTIASDVPRRIAWLEDNGQSAAGYFLEEGGTDLGYGLAVTLPYLAELYQQTHDPRLIHMVRKWVGFTSLMALPEFDGSGFVVFDALNTRTTLPELTGTPEDSRDARAFGRQFIDFVPSISVFFETRAEKMEARSSWAQSSSDISPRERGDIRPRLMHQIPAARLGADASEREAQINNMTPLKESRFTRSFNSPGEQSFLFVRRPGYYFAGSTGKRATDRVRSGPGLLWGPRFGTLVASRGGSSEGYWTSTSDGMDSARIDSIGTYFKGNSISDPEIDPEDLVSVSGLFTASFSDDEKMVSKFVTFEDNKLSMRIRAKTTTQEVIPFLLRVDDAIKIDDQERFNPRSIESTRARSLSIFRGDAGVSVTWDQNLQIRLKRSTYTYFKEGLIRHTLYIYHDGNINLAFKFS
ncbi:hypothetical protein [Microbacterium sp. 18062]|uniref:hypothetical protein n=1 Tax=Microbacterium sp. 18062 TaxID=2681410 RepID=UPI0013590A0C|nr:hypothetical protein [Microbacterium sp. 18062]